MRIAVMGAGAIGLLYGGWLQQAGADVTFLARGERLAALRNSAIAAVGHLPFTLDRIQTAAGPQEVPVGAVTAILGGPFFLYLLRKHRRRAGAAA